MLPLANNPTANYFFDLGSTCNSWCVLSNKSVNDCSSFLVSRFKLLNPYNGEIEGIN